MNVILIIVIIAITFGIVKAVKEKRRQEEKAQKNNELLDAVRRGDKQTVQRLISEGVDINDIWCGDYGGYPLQIAVENRDKEMALFLIEKGANVNYGKRPLIIAVQNGDKEMISLLIDKGAKVNLDFHGKLPLEFAENDELIALLRSHGAITQKEQDAFNTDFVVAVGCHDVEKTKSLISQVSNIDAIDNGLIVEMVGERLDGAGGEQVRKSEATPLIYSVWNDDIEMVKLLVENGANTEIRDSHDKTALMYAAMHFGAEHNVEILEFLISKGANVNAMCSDPADNIKYQTALMFATINGDVDGVQALIRAGADVNAKAFRGLDSLTALGCAKYCGFKEIEILLRKSGARD